MGSQEITSKSPSQFILGKPSFNFCHDPRIRLTPFPAPCTSFRNRTNTLEVREQHCVLHSRCPQLPVAAADKPSASHPFAAVRTGRSPGSSGFCLLVVHRKSLSIPPCWNTFTAYPSILCKAHQAVPNSNSFQIHHIPNPSGTIHSKFNEDVKQGTSASLCVASISICAIRAAASSASTAQALRCVAAWAATSASLRAATVLAERSQPHCAKNPQSMDS